MSNLVWKATPRSKTGKGAARKLRAAGDIPVVAYGKDLESTLLSLETRMVADHLRSGNWAQSLINLDVEGKPELKEKTFMIREMQRHHISGLPLSLDLVAIRMDQKIKVEVPVEFLNTDLVKLRDGILEVLHRSLDVQCLPNAIPSSLEADVGELEVGHTLHLRDIVLPEGVEIDLPEDYPLCTVVVPKVVEEVKPEVEEEEGAEEAEGEEAAAEGDEEKEKTEEQPAKEEKKK